MKTEKQIKKKIRKVNDKLRRTFNDLRRYRQLDEKPFIIERYAQEVMRLSGQKEILTWFLK